MFGLARTNRLLLSGPRIITNGGGATVSTTQSKFGGSSMAVSVSTQNTNAYINAASDYELAFGTGEFTYECWIYPTAITGSASQAHYFIDGRQATSDNNQIGINVSSTTTNTGNILVTGLGSNPLLTSSTTVTINTWYHIAVVRYAGTLTLYIDGVSRASSSTSPVQAPIRSNDITIGRGRTATAQTFRGYMDEVRFSNIARYTAGFTPPTAAFTNDANTVLLLHMDGTNGSTTFTDDNA